VRYLLAVDVLADGASLDPTSTIHVMTRAPVSREQLPGLVGDALKEGLSTGSDSFVAASPGASATLGCGLSCGTAWEVSRV
jgi:hypothetical protein